jgi:hypothetical protein
MTVLVGDGMTFFTVFFTAVLVFVWVALGIACWVFWRAKKRDDAKRKEREWGNAPSS